MARAASSSSSDTSEYSVCSVNSGHDSDVVVTPNVLGSLLYQYEPVARETIADEPNLQRYCKREPSWDDHVVSLTADNPMIGPIVICSKQI